MNYAPAQNEYWWGTKGIRRSRKIKSLQNIFSTMKGMVQDRPRFKGSTINDGGGETEDLCKEFFPQKSQPGNNFIPPQKGLGIFFLSFLSPPDH